MGKKQKTVEQQIAEYEKDIGRETARWNYIMAHGSGDPFWPDGTNLNLVRNHIIYDLRKIHELRQKPTQLSLFDSYQGSGSVAIEKDKRVPPEVAQNFMATNRKLCR